MFNSIFLISEYWRLRNSRSIQLPLWLWIVIYWIVHSLELPQLTEIVTGTASFYYTESLVLSGWYWTKWLIRPSSSLLYCCRWWIILLHKSYSFWFDVVQLIDWFDLPRLTSFTTMEMSFRESRSLVLESPNMDVWWIRSCQIHSLRCWISVILQFAWVEYEWHDYFEVIDMIFLNLLILLLERIHSRRQRVLVSMVSLMMTNWFELPHLTDFIVGEGCFMHITSISLESVMFDHCLNGSSSIDYIHCRILCIPRNKEYSIW